MFEGSEDGLGMASVMLAGDGVAHVISARLYEGDVPHVTC